MTDRGTPGPPATPQQPGTPGTPGMSGAPPGSALADLRARVSVEVAKVVVGQQPIVDAMLTSMAVGGHLLLEGAPGVAKTLLATAVGRALGLEVRRVQFTPDLLPTDLTGTLILRGAELVFRQGPVFTNLLVADEINRTPPKTQAALLEAMQEAQVSVDGVARRLPDPFLVVATENPIEYEGTYPLPEAQLDRFLMKLDVGYPSAPDEEAMLRLRHSGVVPTTLEDVVAVGGIAQLQAARAQVDAVTASDAVIGYVAAVVRRTREVPSVALGASPRAAVHLLAAAKAVACMWGRNYVVPDDVVNIAGPVLRHRLLLTPEAELDRFRPDDALRTVLSSVPVPR
ncbi:MAG: MoxR family ATPase [Acidimicrobiales bacterium]|nr:MoxR family ATPase [Acidimicrobiales bacterium]